MNKDEVTNLIPVAVGILAPLAAKYGIGSGDLTAAFTGLSGIAIALYIHWNMKRVPEASVVVAVAPPAPVKGA